MLFRNRWIRRVLTTTAMLIPVMITGCATHVGVGYRVRDPYYRDYHRWEGPEVGYYNQWVVETHRPSNREFRRLKRQEQKDYWKWRHDKYPDHH